MTRDADALRADMTGAALKWEAEHGYITLHDYFGDKPHTQDQEANAIELLKCVNALLAEFVAQGGKLEVDQDTGTHISGSKGGHGDGGFRLSNAVTGKPGSAHKEGMAVDVYDAGEKLDEWISRDILVRYGLFREAAPHTIGWCHLQTREPKSGNRSFNP